MADRVARRFSREASNSLVTSYSQLMTASCIEKTKCKALEQNAQRERNSKHLLIDEHYKLAKIKS